MTDLYARAFRGEHVQVERTIPHDGETQHFLISVHPIIENGAVTGATVFSKDITERKRVEEQAREHQAELAHVLRLGTMGEMAAGLAHEINQPLGAIANYAQGCVRRLRSGSNDAAALLPIVEEIAREALRAGEIIRRLRDLVRKESPQQQVGRSQRAGAQVDPDDRARGAAARHSPAPRRWRPTSRRWRATPFRSSRCCSTCCSTASRRCRWRATASARSPSRTAPAGPNGVEVSIRDSGVGIPEPPIDVFAPFFSTKAHGLGMGLSISRSIIEAHGGRLTAARNPDGGSTFRFTLPADLRADTGSRVDAVPNDRHRCPPRRRSARPPGLRRAVASQVRERGVHARRRSIRAGSSPARGAAWRWRCATASRTI